MDKEPIKANISQFPTLEEFLASLITEEEVTRQINEKISTLKEEVSDLIGAQFDGFKIEQVADAVKAAVADAKRMANMDSFKEVKQKFHVDYTLDTIKGLIVAMEDIRREIHTKRQTLRTVRQSLADADLDVKEAEAGLLSDIMAEVNNSTGKPLFSNDKARQAELMVRKKEDANYCVIAQQYKTVREQAEALEDEVAALDGELKTAEMQFQAECRSLEAMTAEMNIYAAALGAGASAGAVSIGIGGNSAGSSIRSMIVNGTIPAGSVIAPGSEQINAKINTEPKGW